MAARGARAAAFASACARRLSNNWNEGWTRARRIGLSEPPARTRLHRGTEHRNRLPAVASGIGQFAAVQAVAPSLGVELSPVDVRDAGEIERAVTAFARGLNGGLTGHQPL